jgi:23S rRNA-/tRNA-specific pseudouridylate synthase
VRKRYLALVAGEVSVPGTVRTPIAHRPRRRREMWACADAAQARALGARPALTMFRPCWSTARASLLEIDIVTGARHQIRVHLASLGHAVLGDPLYAPPEALPAPRLMLHAASLEFRHPVSGEAMRIESPPPPDFSAVLDGYGRRARRVR